MSWVIILQEIDLHKNVYQSPGDNVIINWVLVKVLKGKFLGCIPTSVKDDQFSNLTPWQKCAVVDNRLV